MNTEARHQPLSAWRTGIALAALLLVTVIVLGKDITVGGFRHGDSAAHAMDGVLIHDWVGAGPDAWADPLGFATKQYAHYPTLGIGRHYPPGFAVVEAAFFGVFGISPLSARLCVVFFGVLASLGTYVFSRRYMGRPAATLAAVVLITLPGTTLWGRQVMLELPTLSILIWAGIAMRAYLERPSLLRLLGTFALCVLAMLFKQPAVFLTAAIAATLLVGLVRRRTPGSHAILAMLIAGGCIAAVVASLDGHGAKLLRGDATFEHLWSLTALTSYLCELPRHLGLPVVIAAVVGALVTRRSLGPISLFLVAWVAVCYAMLTAADFKNPRFIYLAVFPFAVFAGGAVEWACHRISRREAYLPSAVAATLGLACCAQAMAAPVAHRPEYGAVVSTHRDKILGRAVLFSGLRDGDFVFAVRQYLPWRQAVVVRGSKLLYTCNGRPNLEFVSNVVSMADVESLMRRYAFEYVFVERENKLRLPEDAMLRRFLEADGLYRRVDTCRFEMERRPTFRDTTLELFHVTETLPRLVKQFDILIPRANRVVRVNLGDWS